MGASLQYRPCPAPERASGARLAGLRPTAVDDESGMAMAGLFTRATPCATYACQLMNAERRRSLPKTGIAVLLS